jgi:hypothetical protein
VIPPVDVQERTIPYCRGNEVEDLVDLRVGQAKDLAGGLLIVLPGQLAPGSELAIVQFFNGAPEVRLHLEAHFYQPLAGDQEQVAAPANHVVAILLAPDDSPVAPIEHRRFHAPGRPHKRLNGLLWQQGSRLGLRPAPGGNLAGALNKGHPHGTALVA